jgi:hypothetical protein
MVLQHENQGKNAHQLYTGGHTDGGAGCVRHF